MSIEVTVRHLNVSNDLQAYARGKAERVMEEFPKTEFVHVILDHARHLFNAELTAQHKGPVRVGATAEDPDMIKAIDAATEKLEKQLRKHHDKVVDHHHRP